MADAIFAIELLEAFRDRNMWTEEFMTHEDSREKRIHICENAIEVIKEQQAEIELLRSQDEEWHKTSEELPKLTGDHDIITVQCFDSPESWMIEKGIDKKVYILHYCRRTIRGKIVDRFESEQYTLVSGDPEYWKYLSEPPMVKKEGEKND